MMSSSSSYSFTQSLSGVSPNSTPSTSYSSPPVTPPLQQPGISRAQSILKFYTIVAKDNPGDDTPLSQLLKKVMVNYKEYLTIIVSPNKRPKKIYPQAKSILYYQLFSLKSSLFFVNKIEPEAIDWILADVHSFGELVKKELNTDFEDLILNVTNICQKRLDEIPEKNYVPEKMNTGFIYSNRKYISPEDYLAYGKTFLYNQRNYKAAIQHYENGLADIKKLVELKLPTNPATLADLLRGLADCYAQKAHVCYEDLYIGEAINFAVKAINLLSQIPNPLFTDDDAKLKTKYQYNYSSFMNDYALSLFEAGKYKECFEWYNYAKQQAPYVKDSIDQYFLAEIQRNIIISGILVAAKLKATNHFEDASNQIESTLKEFENIPAAIRTHEDYKLKSQCRNLQLLTHFYWAQHLSNTRQTLPALVKYNKVLDIYRDAPNELTDNNDALINSTYDGLKFTLKHLLSRKNIDENYEKIYSFLQEAINREVFYRPLQINYTESLMELQIDRVNQLYSKFQRVNDAIELIDNLVPAWNRAKIYDYSAITMSHFIYMLRLAADIFMKEYAGTENKYSKIYWLKATKKYINLIPASNRTVDNANYINQINQSLMTIQNDVKKNLNTLVNAMTLQLDAKYQIGFFKLKATPAHVHNLLTSSINILNSGNELSEEQLKLCENQLAKYVLGKDHETPDLNLVEDIEKIIKYVLYLRVLKEEPNTISVRYSTLPTELPYTPITMAAMEAEQLAQSGPVFNYSYGS